MTNFGIVTCPKCNIRVLPKQDGTCPNCQTILSPKESVTGPKSSNAVPDSNKRSIVMSQNPGRYLRKLPLIIGLGFFSVHWVISFLLLQPKGLHLWPCSDFFTIVLTGPGILLSILLYIPSTENTLDNAIRLISSDQEAVVNFFAMTFTSCLYGLAGGFVFSFDKNILQALGITLFVVLMVVGYIALVFLGMPCA